MAGNMMIDCERASIRVDARGLSRNYAMDDRRLGNDFRSVHPDQDPWHKRFPEMLNLLKTDPRIPSGVILKDNVVCLLHTFAPQHSARKSWHHGRKEF